MNLDIHLKSLKKYTKHAPKGLRENLMADDFYLTLEIGGGCANVMSFLRLHEPQAIRISTSNFGLFFGCYHLENSLRVRIILNFKTHAKAYIHTSYNEEIWITTGVLWNSFSPWPSKRARMTIEEPCVQILTRGSGANKGIFLKEPTTFHDFVLMNYAYTYLYIYLHKTLSPSFSLCRVNVFQLI